jgi:hypothetical protein
MPPVVRAVRAHCQRRSTAKAGVGPVYTGTVRVIGPDEYDLDRDGNGVGCERS